MWRIDVKMFSVPSNLLVLYGGIRIVLLYKPRPDLCCFFYNGLGNSVTAHFLRHYADRAALVNTYNSSHFSWSGPLCKISSFCCIRAMAHLCITKHIGYNSINVCYWIAHKQSSNNSFNNGQLASLSQPTRFLYARYKWLYGGFALNVPIRTKCWKVEFTKLT